MRKLILILCALFVLSDPLQAQTISARSTAEECLLQMGLIISGNDRYNQEYDFRGTRIVRTAHLADTSVLEHVIDVNWAGYRDITVEKDDYDLIVTLHFDHEHAIYMAIKENNIVRSRDISRSKTFQFRFPPELKDQYLPEFTQGAERLKQFAKSNASPLLKLTRSGAWIQNIPTFEEYEKNMYILGRAIAPWTISFFPDGRGWTAFALVEYRADGEEGQAVMFDSDMIRSVNVDSAGFVFEALTRHRPNPTAPFEMRMQQSYSFPFAENKAGDDRSELLKYFKLFLWENGVGVAQGGFKVDNL